jgi:transcriptional regulator with XRE-family HTH domain
VTGAEVKALRDRLRLSQEQFAGELRKINPAIAPNRHTVSRWEAGNVAPSTDAVLAMEALRRASYLTQGMDADTLAGIIRQEGALKIAEMVADFAKQVVPALSHGWDFAGWEVTTEVPGVALFGRRPSYGSHAAEGVMVVNAPRSDWWEAQAAQSPFPVILLWEDVVR